MSDQIADEASISTPALLLYSERVEENLRRMIRLAGSPERLWPHVKTHKMGPLIERQIALGITRFKCATIAEAELCARSGAGHVLLAQQLVGPHPARFAALAKAFPQVRFSTLFDDATAAHRIAQAASGAGVTLDLLLDLDVGQHRTGIAPDERAAGLYSLLPQLHGVRPGGLHAYDGHLHQSDSAIRGAACAEAFAPVRSLAALLRSRGLTVPRVIAGGTPTFPFHAAAEDVECSPGTCVLWDAGYGSKLPDLDFLPAALLLTRVVSKPGPRQLTLDLGHKSVASEMPHPRAVFPALPDATVLMHNEEHLVIETGHADRFALGDTLYAIPWHVCPTVALHAEATVITGGQVSDCWPILARARRLHF